MSVVPCARPLHPRAQKRLIVAFEFHAVPARHEQRFRDRRAIALAGLGTILPLRQLRQRPHGGRPLPLHIARWKTHQQMRRAEVGFHAVGVKLLRGGVLIHEVLPRLPVGEVLRHRRADGPVPLRLPRLAIGPAPSEDAPVRSVGTDVGIVKGQILRVERAFGDDGLGMHQRKAQSVRGMENQQPMRLGAADHGLVARLRWAVRMLVAKHRRMTRIRSHAIKRPGCQHNVVRFGTTELHQSQLRLAPVHAVIALRITAKKRMPAGVHLAVLHGDVPGLVIHPVFARGGIQKDTVIAAARALPGGVVRDCNLSGLRMMQLLPRTAAQRFNQIAVHKQLTP